MAALKIKQLRSTLGTFAALYERAEAHEQAAALRQLTDALAKADNLSVDEVMGTLQKVGVRTQLKNTGNQKH
jgi:hypothetical protein